MVNKFAEDFRGFFSEEEMVTVVEFARIGMENSHLRESVGTMMDVNESVLAGLAKKLAEFMHRDTV